MGIKNLKNHVKSNEEIVKHNLKVVKIGKGELKFDKIILYLTPICNLNCVGCYTKVDPNATSERLSFIPEIKDVLDDSKKIGISGLVIPGSGEPMFDPEFWRVMEYSSNIDLIYSYLY